MSRAFVKEDAGDGGDGLPDRPVSPHVNYVTPEGLALIDAKLARLQDELAAAGDDRAAQARVQRDLRYWRARHASAEVVRPPADPSEVRFGATVTIRREGGRTQTFRIVGEDEADPARGSLAYVAPLAGALMGKRVGDVIEVAGSEAEIVRITGNDRIASTASIPYAPVMVKATATLTIRRLDERVKRKLRLRAAAHARSMEDEVRSILGAELAGAAPRPTAARDEAPSRATGGAAAVVSKSARATGLDGAAILLVIAGGIAAYKSLDLIRRLREQGAVVDAVMTAAAQQFVTPLSVGALTGRRVFTDLFDRAEEHEIGHIRLARGAGAIVAAPATADLMARMASGQAGDLATTILLAADAPVLLAPAMNPTMWAHPATRRNLEMLRTDGVHFIGPNAGEMAEAGEAGTGRMAEPLEIVAALDALLAPAPGPLAGRRIIVTSGPTHEAIDPVRYLANRSSGRQGHAIAAAARDAGADVTLVSGPVAIPDPPGVTIVHVESALEMLDAVVAALPADIAVMTAAVADWRLVSAARTKIKKDSTGRPPTLALAENPDILATVARHKTLRPALVVGFAAETDDLLKNAGKKLKAKGADWIVANDVSSGAGVMGGEENTVHLISAAGVEDWPRLPKSEVAARLVARIANALTVGRTK